MKVLLLMDDVDVHGFDCGCGDCNHATGKSYGCAIIDATGLDEDTDLDCMTISERLLERVYGPNEHTAEDKAK